MLRLSKLLFTGAAATALLASAPALAQNGLGSRLDAQEQQLSQAENSCGPVNLAEYANLLNEASQNKARADKMAKKGIPVNQAQVNADLAKAMQLFARAQAAQARNCMLQAQQPHALLPHGEQSGTAVAAGGTNGACPTAPTPASAATNLSDRARIPTQDEVNHLGELMDNAGMAGRRSEADSVLRDLDEMGLRLNKAIIDAKKVGEFTSLDVKEAEKRLKQIDDWRRAGEKFRLPCAPQPKEAETQPAPKSTSALPGGRPLKGDYANAQVGGNSPVGNPADIMTVYQGPQGQGVNFAPGLNLNNYQQAIINAHNAVRYKIGSPPMHWDPVLEQYGLARSQELAHSNGQLVHASREGREKIRENILKAPASYSIEDQMKLWTNEFNDFVPGTFPSVCREGGECEGVWHFTQMGWPTTLAVGCGSTVAGGFVYTVCGYPKGGNQDGKEIGTKGASVLGDAAFRKAMLEAINRQSIVDNIAAAHSDYVDRDNPNALTSVNDVDPDLKAPRPDRRGAWYVGGDFGAMIVEDVGFDYGLHLTTPAPTSLSFMINGTPDFGDDGGIEAVTFYDPAFALAPTSFDSVADGNYLAVGSWRRGVRVGTNMLDDLGGANPLFQDIGVVNFGDVTSTDQGTANDSDREIIDRLEADNNPLKPTTPIKDQAAAYVQQWHDEYGNFAKARDANDGPGMRDAYEKLAKITRTYFNVYSAAKDGGVDMHDAFDADDMESNLAMTWEEYKKAICKAPAAPQAQGTVDTKVDAPTLPTKEVFTPGVRPPLPDNGSGTQLYLPQDTETDCVM